MIGTNKTNSHILQEIIEAASIPQHETHESGDVMDATTVQNDGKVPTSTETATFVLSGISFYHLTELALMTGLSGYIVDHQNPTNTHFVVQGSAQDIQKVYFDLGKMTPNTSSISLSYEPPLLPVKPGIFTVYETPVDIQFVISPGHKMNKEEARKAWELANKDLLQKRN